MSGGGIFRIHTVVADCGEHLQDEDSVIFLYRVIYGERCEIYKKLCRQAALTVAASLYV